MGSQVDSPSFHSAIHQVFKREQDPAERKKKICELVSGDPMGFKAWAEKHSTIVQLSPFFQKIKVEEVKESSQLAQTAFLTDKIGDQILEKIEAGILANDKEILNHYFENNINNNHFWLLLEYAKFGIIDKNYFHSIIKSRVLPKVNLLDPELVKEILAVKDEQGQIFLESPRNFSESFSTIKTLALKNPSLFLEILSLKDKKGRPIIHDFFKLDIVMRHLFERSDYYMIRSTLLIKDDRGRLAFHHVDFMKKFPLMAGCIAGLDLGLLSEILTFRDGKGDTPLHTAFTESLSIAEQYGLNINLSDLINKEGMTPVDQFIQFSPLWRQELESKPQESHKNVLAKVEALPITDEEKIVKEAALLAFRKAVEPIVSEKYPDRMDLVDQSIRYFCGQACGADEEKLIEINEYGFDLAAYLNCVQSCLPEGFVENFFRQKFDAPSHPIQRLISVLTSFGVIGKPE